MSRTACFCHQARLWFFLAVFATSGLSAAHGAVSPAEVAQSGVTGSQDTPNLVNRAGNDPRASRGFALGVGDVIHINVFEEPQFSNSLVIRPDGKISLPLISEVYVAGLTPTAIEQLLTVRLEKYINHPRVTVTVQEIHSRVVYVTGEVLRPGAYALAGNINVVQLIARAGGVTAYAKKKNVYVLHAGTGVRTKVDYRKVLLGQHVEQNVQLASGDTVVVP
jgi:polysaccharide export outer membrane protein